MKSKEWCRILSQEKIAADIYSMWLETPSIAPEARAGQFVSLYCGDKSRLLPRPISLCEVDREARRIRLVYRIAGKGTEEFSNMKAGEQISVLGPLGNGFPLERARGRRAILFGGGIGIPPMLETAKQLKGEKSIVLGYRDELPICVGYEIDGKVTRDFPVTVKLEKAKPVWKVLPGWKCDIRGIKNYEELPENCRNYIETIEKELEVPVTMVSNGPGRHEIIRRK